MALDLGTDNGIYISDKAKSKVVQLMNDAGVAGKPDYFCGLALWVAVAVALVINSILIRK